MWRSLVLKVVPLYLILSLLLPVETLGEQPDSSRSYGTIEVTISPVTTDDGGKLLISLYDSEDSWLKLEEAVAIRTVPAETDSVIVLIDSIAPGDYALSVIHDKNENGKFDMRWFPFPKPKEGAGVSNNHRRRGKPEYDKAVFSVASDVKSLWIEMVY
jgi:uncharacterized protein (DUF2141 family)